MSCALPTLVLGEQRVEADRDLRVPLGLVVVRARGCDHALLIEQLRLEVRLQRDQRRLRAVELLFGGERLELHIGVRELDEHGGRGHGRTGSNEHALDPPGRDGRNELNPLGLERARAAHLAHHLAATNGIDPERSALDRGRRRLQPAEGDA